MPLLRYFIYVGGTLIALLFVASYLFPEVQTVAHQDVTRPTIRITTDKVGPPRVDFDTSVQTAAVPTLPPGVMLLQAPSAMQARAQLIAPPSSVAAAPVKSEAKLEPRNEIKKTKVARRTASYPHYAAYPYPYSYGYQPFRWTW